MHPADADETIRIPLEGGAIEATLRHPQHALGVVIFAHGSGSSRFSPRNRFVADVLERGGFATLLLDLLTPQEERIDLRTRHIRFDIDRLTHRLVAAIDWLSLRHGLGELPGGLFGASTGAAAALAAAAQRPNAVQAVVSRGGRPDLADGALAEVRAATLLIVGGNDEPVIELNEIARRRLEHGVATAVQLEIVPGATHLFEEPGALERVATLARDWLTRFLAPLAASPTRTPR
jgi:dienelactone hydrolase